MLSSGRRNIDGTLCTNTDGDYTKAKPFSDPILHVNMLFAAGHTIKFFTARGSTTGVNWYESTFNQMSGWGVHFHELIVGKPYAEIFIEDTAIH